MREPSIVDADGVTRSLAALVAAADGLAAELPPARPGSLATFAFEHDHAALLVALWATWLRGHTVALPQDARRLAVGATMQLPESVVFLHDTGAGQRIRMVGREWPRAGAGSVRDDMPYGAILHCVPRRSGELWRTPVDVAELRRRVAAAAAAMPLPDDARLVVTYAAGHLPALAPGLLMPLQHGAAILSACGWQGSALLDRLASARATDLLAPPDVLRELARRPRGALAGVQRLYTLAALDRASRERLQREHGVTVQEVGMRGPGLAALPAAVEALLAVPGVVDAAVAQRSVQGVECTFAMIAVEGDREAVAAAARSAIGVPAARLALVDRLPRDRNGELDDDLLLFACGVRADGSRSDRTLHWREERRSGGVWQATVVLPADHPGFDGHFVGYPVLSGSVQLHDVVQPALARAFGAPVSPTEYSDLKFLSRIRPGETLQITVDVADDRGGATFVLTNGATRCTTGRATWRASEALR